MSTPDIANQVKRGETEHVSSGSTTEASRTTHLSRLWLNPGREMITPFWAADEFDMTHQETLLNCGWLIP
jgi:hypothetical protein